jgi:hypothetical protein
MIEVKSSLNGDTEKKLDPTKAYLVDFSRMNSVNDLMIVLAALGIIFPATHQHIEVLKPFLNLDNPIDIPQNQQQNGKR